MARKLTFMDTPVGANKKYLVTCSGEVWAGFNSMAQARGYITMQMSKKNGKGGPAHSTEKTWDVRNR